MVEDTALGHGWGTSDEAGAANFIDPQAVLRGAAEVRSGTRVPLAAPIRNGRGFGLVGRPAPQHFMLRTGGDYAAGMTERAGFGFADDMVTLPTHGATHVDALAHVWQDGRMYNGFSANEVTSRGARRLGIEKMPPIVTRGVLVDTCPGGVRAAEDPVHLDELQSLLQTTEVELSRGDALLVRTGWLGAALSGEATAESWPGLHHDCAPWLAEQRVSLVGADNPAVEAFPSGDPSCQVPLHIALIRDRGVYLAEFVSLDELVSHGRPTFQFVLAPLPLVGAVGSPVAPVAIL